MRRAVTSWIALLTVVALVIACGPTDDNANGGIGGTSWTVTSINGAPTVPDARPTMVFEFGGSLSGSSGCNQYSGTFRTEGDRIAVGQLGSTMMACDGAGVMAQEQAFTAALGGATTWRLTEQGSLQLEGSGDIEAEPAAGP